MLILSIIIIICAITKTVHGSYGDQSPYYGNCVIKCISANCTEDKIHFFPDHVPSDPITNLLWNCQSECKYECMWKTTELFQKRKWKIPQFHGKWPFIRLYGIQEPASTLFSLFNFYAHYYMFKRFRNSVRKDGSLYWFWYGHSLTALNAWIWSMIFHIRDTPFTELMDYLSAFSVVLANSYYMFIRLFWNIGQRTFLLVSVFYAAFLLNHCFYLSFGRFDYGYNMMMNISVGGVTVLGSLTWSILNSKQQPYLWKCIAFYGLSAFVTILEVFDFPPLWWTFDSHALWHLSTVFVCPFLYSFVIDDCAYLRKQQFLYTNTNKLPDNHIE